MRSTENNKSNKKMENNENQVLDSGFVTPQSNKRRRSLLPWWIKTFTWIFMIFGTVAPIGLLLGLLGFQFQISFYGIETNNPLSMIGIILIGTFLLKGITAFGLWTEKDWAIVLGQIDAIFGICFCIFVMFISPMISNLGFKLTFRLELLLLIPFLIKLGKIKNDWRSLVETNVHHF